VNPHEIREVYSTRSQLTMNLLSFFSDSHLHPILKDIVAPIRELAFSMVDDTIDGPELAVALRSLLDAKDHFVRHYLVTHNFKLPPQLVRSETSSNGA
jgi:hypothetical protein